jgi:hypothetical protein
MSIYTIKKKNYSFSKQSYRQNYHFYNKSYVYKYIIFLLIIYKKDMITYPTYFLLKVELLIYTNLT